MKIKDVVKRIITVSESEELYTKNINEILQREISSVRIRQLKEYLNNNSEHFFSSIIVAIFHGDPKWSDFDLEPYFSVDNKILDSETTEFIENKLGVLSLSGDEIIFALDGQHRIKGIREAFKQNESIGEEDVSLIFVVHDHDNKERTRRLFTVLNKYAQKPKEAELIVLDEDDAAAIITRRLLDTHEILRMKNAISNSNSPNLPSNDFCSFTTLVMLNRINKIILANYKIDYTKRPKDNVLNEYYQVCSMFWDYFFNQFPQIQRFIQGENVMFEKGDLYNRNNQTGGSLLLRPVGQKIFAQIYNAFNEKGQLEQLTAKIPYLDFNLNGPLCKYITWNNKILPKSESLQKRLLFYVLGLFPDESIHDDLKSVYENFGVQYNNRFEIIDAR
jgi:DNA sulfur modification protein DndB